MPKCLLRMKPSVTFLFCLVLAIIGYGSASKILFVEAICVHSHYTLGSAIAKELAAKGHQVTLIAGYKQKEKQKNLQEVFVNTCDVWQEQKIDMYEMGQKSYWNFLDVTAGFGYSYSEKVLQNPQIQKLLNSSEHFDLVITEHFFNEALYIFPHKFKCPSVTLVAGPITMFNNYMMGNPAPSSYVPNILTGYGPDMDFWRRMKNIYVNLLGDFFIHYNLLPNMDKIIQKHVPGAPALTDIIYDTSIMLLYSHSGFEDPVPLQPNIKEIGGYHVLPAKQLPTEIKDFLDSAKEGVILFSMGSILKSADFSEYKINAVLNVFSKLKQKVLWKFEGDLSNIPSNVKIMKWLPQRDVLAHPNVVAFISHVGLLGTFEAIYSGVPILGLPVFWDQAKNADNAVRKGIALKLNFFELNEESFDEALAEILNNPKYRDNARRLSHLIRDQPMKQMDEAIFWIEYAIRNNGSHHLRSSAVQLKWYQIYLIDVFVFVFVTLGILVLISYKLIRLLFSMRHIKPIEAIKKNK